MWKGLPELQTSDASRSQGQAFDEGLLQMLELSQEARGADHARPCLDGG